MRVDHYKAQPNRFIEMMATSEDLKLTCMRLIQSKSVHMADIEQIAVNGV